MHFYIFVMSVMLYFPQSILYFFSIFRIDRSFDCTRLVDFKMLSKHSRIMKCQSTGHRLCIMYL